MRTARRVVASAALALSCAPGGEAPEPSVIALPGGNGVLEVSALTLREGAHNPELYATLHNVGDHAACSAAFAVELYDDAEQSLAAGITGLLTPRLYRLREESGTFAACLGPGERTVAALTELPADLAIDRVRSVVYRCPYFALDVEPSPGLALQDVQLTAAAYTGTLVNELPVTVRRPSLTVYSLSRSGRPLAAATSGKAGELLPGERWAFSVAIATPGVEYIACPAGALGR